VEVLKDTRDNKSPIPDERGGVEERELKGEGKKR
jgi:hypothetical protein